MEAKMIRVTSGEFLYVNPDVAEQDVQEEIDILTRVSDSVRPRCLPVGVEFVEQHTYRNALFSTVHTVQIFNDDRWNEFRVRNVKNGDEATCIDTLYRGKKYDDVMQFVEAAFRKEMTF